MRVAVDDAGHNAAAGRRDLLIVAAEVVIRKLRARADPDDAIAFENHRAVFDRRVEGTVDDLAQNRLTAFSSRHDRVTSESISGPKQLLRQYDKLSRMFHRDRMRTAADQHHVS